MKKALLIFLLFSTPASAQILKETTSEAVKFAGSGGRTAGAAYYCKMDEEALDEFIGMAHGRMSNLAADKVDKVVAQLEFSNNFSAWSSRPPPDGCEAFIAELTREFPKIFK